jgi:hypothetical protein
MFFSLSLQYYLCEVREGLAIDQLDVVFLSLSQYYLCEVREGPAIVKLDVVFLSLSQYYLCEVREGPATDQLDVVLHSLFRQMLKYFPSSKLLKRASQTSFPI